MIDLILSTQQYPRTGVHGFLIHSKKFQTTSKEKPLQKFPGV